MISGGAINASFGENNDTKCMKRLTNNGNECFWWCLTILMNKNNPIYLKLKDLRYTTKFNQMAQGLCEDCGFYYSKEVNVESIPSMKKQICEASGIG